MPQMAPLSWLLLLFFFSMIFMMFNSLNYFIYNYNSKKNINNKINMKYNWKW